MHTFTAGENGIFVNGYLVETAEAVVLIDSTLLVSDARALKEKIAQLGKPVVGAFVTHPHPDHFNGLPYVVSEETPVYSTAAVAKVIADSADAKRAQWGPTYGAEWPDRYRVPETLVESGSAVEIGGVRVTVHEVGPGESHADSWILVRGGEQRVAFIGDLAFGGVHSYMTDGHSTEWLAALERLGTELAGLTLYPGHGPAGDAGLLAAQRKYLVMYREAVERLRGQADSLTEEQKGELAARMAEFEPGAGLGWLVPLGADPVAAELAAAATADGE
ncbi:MBL fold metallo-hydrolase [Nocardia sp. NBC_01503]|uniref:MBL fold metallo-hydrolase n=1 Tax=Nocardia sp. NBC_01503 TaxID=2975997 RepID=UPI002E7B8F4A|nr:MBL fold metallo-hydrolase [Nocardia sp. NBC_01503]WTL34636.1 MBL fold metallo-hydrolase [Nocardia sp. NBC_01503]